MLSGDNSDNSTVASNNNNVHPSAGLTVSSDHVYSMTQSHNISLCTKNNTNAMENIRSIFHGSTISGGTFNINIHYDSASSGEKHRVKRPRVLYSSDSDE